MSEILISATFPNIAEENLEEFTKRAEESVTDARGEAGTVGYDWFLSADKTRCVVHERYADSPAVLAHLANIRKTIGALATLGGGLEVEVFGDPSPELRQVLSASARTFFSYLTGK